MSINEKLIERFRKQPKDFTYNEMVKLLVGLVYKESDKGKNIRFAREVCKQGIKE